MIRLYKLIALDLDGTTLTSSGDISKAVKESIISAKSQGALITLATGRRLCRTLPFASMLTLEMPLVSHNGAIVAHSTGEVIYKQGISLTVANQLLSELSELNIPHLVYCSDDNGDLGRLLNQFLAHKSDFLTFIDDEVALVEQLNLEYNPIKISVLGRQSQIKPFLKNWQSRYASFTTQIIYQSADYMGVDFIGAGLSKATGVKLILDLFGLNFSDVLAIGDDHNDIPLLEAAGLGIAMDNAPQAVKKIADAIVPSNDHDGVASVLKSWLQSELE